MKVFRLFALFFVIVVGLVSIIFNSKLIGNRWLFFNTNFGPLRLNLNTQVNLFLNEFGTKEKGLVFIRNRKIKSMEGYEAWNPLRDFGGRIVLACKGKKIMRLVNVVFIDIDAERIKSGNNQTKADDFLPNLMTVCLNNSLMKKSVILGDDKIQNLINFSQGMLIMK